MPDYTTLTVPDYNSSTSDILRPGYGTGPDYYANMQEQVRKFREEMERKRKEEEAQRALELQRAQERASQQTPVPTSRYIPLPTPAQTQQQGERQSWNTPYQQAPQLQQPQEEFAPPRETPERQPTTIEIMQRNQPRPDTSAPPVGGYDWRRTYQTPSTVASLAQPYNPAYDVQRRPAQPATPGWRTPLVQPQGAATAQMPLAGAIGQAALHPNAVAQGAKDLLGLLPESVRQLQLPSSLQQMGQGLKDAFLGTNTGDMIDSTMQYFGAKPVNESTAAGVVAEKYREEVARRNERLKNSNWFVRNGWGGIQNLMSEAGGLRDIWGQTPVGIDTQLFPQFKDALRPGEAWGLWADGLRVAQGNMKETDPVYEWLRHTIKSAPIYAAVVQGGKAVTNPADVWSSIFQYMQGQITGQNIPLTGVAAFFDMASKKYQEERPGYKETFFPNPNDTPEQTRAKQYGRYASFSGQQPALNVYEGLLNQPTNVAQMVQQAKSYYDQAAQATDEVTRNHYLTLAGVQGAKASKLASKQPLDFLDENFDLGAAGPFQMLYDPVVWIDPLVKLAGLSPFARRLETATEAASITRGAAVANVEAAQAAPEASTGMGLLKDWFLENSSKMRQDMHNNYQVIANLVSKNTSVKADIKAMIQYYAGNAVDVAQNGFPAEILTDPNLLHQVVDGRFPVGWAGVGDPLAANAAKSLVPEWFNNMSSLAGDGPVNWNHFMPEFMGILLRGAGERIGGAASALGEVPWGTTKLQLNPLPDGTQVIQYLGEHLDFPTAGNVLGQSGAMSPTAAAARMKQLEGMIAKGGEIAQGPIEKVGNLYRRLTSLLVMNTNPAVAINNAGNANINALIDGTWSGVPLEEQTAWMQRMFGGMMPNASMVDPSLSEAQQYWGGGKGILNYLGNLRTGMTTVKGTGSRVKFGEAANNVSIQYAAIQKNLNIAATTDLAPAINEYLTQIGIADPAAIKQLGTYLVQEFMDKGRNGIVDALSNVVMGRSGFTLRGLSPAYSEVIPGPVLAQVDDLLRRVTPETVEQFRPMLNQLYGDALNAAGAAWKSGVPDFPARSIFTVGRQVDEAKDMLNMARLHAEQLGGSEAEIAARAKEYVSQPILDASKFIDDQLKSLLQVINDPQQLHVFYDVWTEIENQRTDIASKNFTALGKIFEDFGSFNPKADAAYKANDVAHKAAMADFQKDAQQLIEHGLTSIQDGTWMQTVQNAERRMMDFLGTSDASIKNAMGLQTFGRADPAFGIRYRGIQQGIGKFVSEAFTMLQRYPTQESIDQLLEARRYESIANAAATRDYVALKNGLAQQVADLGTGVTDAIRNQMTGQHWNASDSIWNKAGEAIMARYHAAAMQMYKMSLSQEMQDGLRFMPDFAGAVSTDEMILLNPGRGKQAAKWVAQFVDSGKIKIVDAQVVPAETIAKYYTLRSAAEAALADQKARIVHNLTQTGGVGIDDIDAMIKSVADERYQDIYNPIASRIRDYMAHNPGSAPAVTDPVNYTIETLSNAFTRMDNILPDIAAANAAGYGKVNLDAVGVFNKNILPLVDNILTGAQKFGASMRSFGIHDYLNKYKGENLIGLFSPYHYFATRAGKNALERMIFDPAVMETVRNTEALIEQDNRRRNEPNRNYGTIQGAGVQIGEKNWAPRDQILRLLQYFPQYVLNGYGNPARQDQSAEWALETTGNQGFGGFAKGIWGAIDAGQQFLDSSSLGVHPWQKFIMDLAYEKITGKRTAYAGELGPLANLIGWGLTAAMGKEIPYVSPPYTGYLAGRDVSMDVSAGRTPMPQGEMQQDVMMQQNTGSAPLPNQNKYFPGVVGQTAETVRGTALEYFFKSLFSWATSIGVMGTDPEEYKLRAQQDEKRRADYGPDNPVGSDVASSSYYDTYKGLGPFNTQHAIIQEPGDESTRPGTRAMQSILYSEKDKLNAAIAAQTGVVDKRTLEGNVWAGSEAFNKAQLADPTLAAQFARKEAIGKELNALPQVPYTQPGDWGKNPLEAKWARAAEIFYGADNLPGAPVKGASGEEWGKWGERKRQYFINTMLQPVAPAGPSGVRAIQPALFTKEEAEAAYDQFRQRYWSETEKKQQQTLDKYYGTKDLLNEQATRRATSAYGPAAPGLLQRYVDTATDFADREAYRALGSPAAQEAYLRANPKFAQQLDARTALMQSHPEVYLMRVAAYEPDKYQEMLSKFGAAHLDEFVRGYKEVGNLPNWPGDNASKEQVAAYYDAKDSFGHKYPYYKDVHMYLQGRWSNENKTFPRGAPTDVATLKTGYDLGKDYQEALAIFGPNIFDMLRTENEVSYNTDGRGYAKWRNANPKIYTYVTGYGEWNNALSKDSGGTVPVTAGSGADMAAQSSPVSAPARPQPGEDVTSLSDRLRPPQPEGYIMPQGESIPPGMTAEEWAAQSPSYQKWLAKGGAGGGYAGGSKGGGGGAPSAFSGNWDEYRALTDWADKYAYMQSHPEFAKYYEGKYGADSAWWKNYVPAGQRTARAGGGGGGGFSYGGGGYSPPEKPKWLDRGRGIQIQRRESRYQVPVGGWRRDWGTGATPTIDWRTLRNLIGPRGGG